MACTAATFDAPVPIGDATFAMSIAALFFFFPLIPASFTVNEIHKGDLVQAEAFRAIFLKFMAAVVTVAFILTMVVVGRCVGAGQAFEGREIATISMSSIAFAAVVLHYAQTWASLWAEFKPKHIISVKKKKSSKSKRKSRVESEFNADVNVEMLGVEVEADVNA